MSLSGSGTPALADSLAAGATTLGGLAVQLADALHNRGFVVVSPLQSDAVLGISAAALNVLQPAWAELPRDGHLRDGGSYRARRHSCFVCEPHAATPLTLVPHRAHWQPVDYNALHGGFERMFEPIAPSVVTDPAWQQLLVQLTELFNLVRSGPRWFIEAHQFRIDTATGIGRPTPEGAHRDGVDFVAVIMVNRAHVKGGETRVFEADAPVLATATVEPAATSVLNGVRFTLHEPWSMLLIDDERVIHETTPLQPDGSGEAGVRDTLVLTFRRDGFQAPRE